MDTIKTNNKNKTESIEKTKLDTNIDNLKKNKCIYCNIKSNTNICNNCHISLMENNTTYYFY